MHARARARQVPVRRQASLLIQHICIDRRRCLADAIRLMQGLLPAAVEHAATSSDYWELFTSLLFAAPRTEQLVGDSEADADPSEADADGGGGSPASLHKEMAPAEDFETPRRELCEALLARVLAPPGCAPSAAPAKLARAAAAAGSERVTVGLLRLLTTLVRSSRGCQRLLGPSVDALCRRCLVPDAQSQPPTGVRHACVALLTAARPPVKRPPGALPSPRRAARLSVPPRRNGCSLARGRSATARHPTSGCCCRRSRRRWLATPRASRRTSGRWTRPARSARRTSAWSTRRACRRHAGLPRHPAFQSSGRREAVQPVALLPHAPRTAGRDLLHELAATAALHGARLPRRLPLGGAAARTALARRGRASAPLRPPARRCAPRSLSLSGPISHSCVVSLALV